MALAISSLEPYVLAPVQAPADYHAVYVRRRLMAALLAIAIVLVGGGLMQKVATALPDVPASSVELRLEAASQPGDTPAAAAAGQIYVVQPGDSMWSIAVQAVPFKQTAAYVDEMVALNGSPALSVGQRLVLPEV